MEIIRYAKEIMFFMLNNIKSRLCLFQVAFIMIWIAFSILFGFVSGWSSLAKSYPGKELQNSFLGFQSIEMANIAPIFYRSCVFIGGDQKGIYLTAFFLFRTNHPPIFIPWRDISIVHRSAIFLFPDTELKFRREPTVSLRIYRAQEELLKEKAGNNWPIQSGK